MEQYFFNHTVPRPSLWYGLSDVTNISDHNVKTPDLHPGEVVMVTASEGSGGFQGIPGLKEMIYENRMTYAHRWGEFFSDSARQALDLTLRRARIYVGEHNKL